MIDVSIITHLPILIYTQTQAYFYDVDLKNKYEALNLQKYEIAVL